MEWNCAVCSKPLFYFLPDHTEQHPHVCKRYTDPSVEAKLEQLREKLTDMEERYERQIHNRSNQ